MIHKGIEALKFNPETGSDQKEKMEIRKIIDDIVEEAARLFRGTEFAAELGKNLRIKADLEYREGKILKREDYIRSTRTYLGQYMMYEKDKSFNNLYKNEIVRFKAFLDAKY